MSCGCVKNRKIVSKAQMGIGMADERKLDVAGNGDVRNAGDERHVLPTEQCIACAQKHMDEAYVLFTEFGYSDENRRLVRGNLRAIVLHTYKEWNGIAVLARECALLVQEARDDEALAKMKELCRLLDEAFYDVNPEVKERLDSFAKKNIE